MNETQSVWQQTMLGEQEDKINDSDVFPSANVFFLPNCQADLLTTVSQGCFFCKVNTTIYFNEYKEIASTIT